VRRLALAAVVAAAAPAVAQEPARPLTLSATVDRALHVSDEVEVLAATAGAADARVAGAKAQRLPLLRAEGNLFLWDKELTFDLGEMSPPGFDSTIRSQITSSVTVTLAQPLSPLLAIGHLIGLERRGARAARADVDRGRLDSAARAADLWLRAVGAQAGQAIAEKSLAQLEAQLERARVLERGGVLGAVDVLRLEAARDAARGAVLQTRTAAETLRRSLAVLLELPALTPLELVDDLPEPPPPPPLDEAAAVERAARGRPELAAAAERLAQAEEGRKVALAGYLPNLMAVASYTHNEGVGTIQPADAAFVGLTLSWDIWNWGKTGASVDEAAQRRQAAAVGVRAVASQVEIEARRRALETATAHEALAIAASALRAAEEAYRIQTVRFEQGAATTTDLLDAETEVARARTGALLARTEYFLALVNLSRATGELPEFIRRGNP
jgi:outer membrane protein TolC